MADKLPEYIVQSPAGGFDHCHEAIKAAKGRAKNLITSGDKGSVVGVYQLVRVLTGRIEVTESGEQEASHD